MLLLALNKNRQFVSMLSTRGSDTGRSIAGQLQDQDRVREWGHLAVHTRYRKRAFEQRFEARIVDDRLNGALWPHHHPWGGKLDEDLAQTTKLRHREDSRKRARLAQAPPGVQFALAEEPETQQLNVRLFVPLCPRIVHPRALLRWCTSVWW